LYLRLITITVKRHNDYFIIIIIIVVVVIVIIIVISYLPAQHKTNKDNISWIQ